MEWTRSETIALARQSCIFCFGLGLVQTRGAKMRPCHCVERAIFRAVYSRFQGCHYRGGPVGRVSLEANPGRQRKNLYAMKNEEFMADFILVSRRVLGDDTLAWRLFNYHFLLGADWKICAKKLGIERGEFFHEVYRIQQHLGRAFRELEPHPLFPVGEYFGGTGKNPVRPCAQPIF